MAKVGLKDTLALLAKGYSKKEIDALAAVDEENEANPAPDPVPETPPPAPEPDPVPETPPPAPEPDYKQLYEDLKKQSDADKATITKLQQDNVHRDSAGAADDAKKKEQDILTNLVRSFM